MISYQTIKQILYPLLTKHKNIGIMLSGGIDSGLLYYLCCKIRSEENLDFNLKLYNTYEGYINVAERLNDYVCKQFDVAFIINKIELPTMHHSAYVFFAIGEALKTSDIVLLGDTTNAPTQLGGLEPNRLRSTHARVFQPFFDYNKSDTIRICKELNLNELISLSRSCTHPTKYVCNECYHCKERSWAFKENNYIDIGI
jgi:7-cyano-7-deazaguanine synthase in queuosine biosynthesis